MVFSGTRRCKPWSYKVHQALTFHWFLDIIWSLVALLSSVNRKNHSNPIRRQLILASHSSFFCLHLWWSRHPPTTHPQMLNVPEVVILIKLKVKYHSKAQNTTLKLLSSVVVSILLLQCYFIITFSVFFHWFFLIWLMVTLFYGAGKFQYLVNNPHHTTFNEDKGVLHTWAILLFLDAIWDWL